MSEKRNINLTIADIPLNLNISAADEEIIRKAAKEINERVLKYKTGNTEPEPFYFLAYVSLLHTIKMLQQEQKFNEIEQINLKLDEFIKEEVFLEFFEHRYSRIISTLSEKLNTQTIRADAYICTRQASTLRSSFGTVEV